VKRQNITKQAITKKPDITRTQRTVITHTQNITRTKPANTTPPNTANRKKLSFVYQCEGGKSKIFRLFAIEENKSRIETEHSIFKKLFVRYCPSLFLPKNAFEGYLKI
jgi:hypothetical protein